MYYREYVADYKLAGTAQVLRLTKPWHGSVLIRHSPVFTTALACRKHGLHFTGLVKTATKFYPKGYMDEIEFAELGDDITLTTTVDGHNIMPHAQGDKGSALCQLIPLLFLEDLLTNADGGKYLMKMGKR